MMLQLLKQLIENAFKDTPVTNRHQVRLVRATDVFMEAVPQLVLQIYIAMVIENKLSSVEWACIIGSFMSACWGTSTYVKESEFSFSTVQQWLILLVTALILPTRAIALGLLGTVKPWLVFAVLGPHLLVISVLKVWESRGRTEKRLPWYTKIISYLNGVMGMFTSFIVLPQQTVRRHTIDQSTISFINGILLVTENIACSLTGYFFGNVATAVSVKTRLSNTYLGLILFIVVMVLSALSFVGLIVLNWNLKSKKILPIKLVICLASTILLWRQSCNYSAVTLQPIPGID